MSRDWRLDWSHQAERDLRRLDRPVRQRVLGALEHLAEDPTAGRLRRLTGREEWRLRVGDWRVRLRLDPTGRAIVIVRVLPRGRAYRN